MVEPVGTLEEAVIRAEAARQPSAPPQSAVPTMRRQAISRDERLDTMATLPLETPVRGPRAGRPAGAPAKSRTWTLVALGVAAAVAAVVAWRARTSSADVTTGPVATSSTITGANATPSAAAPSAAASPSGSPTHVGVPPAGAISATANAPPPGTAPPPSSHAGNATTAGLSATAAAGAEKTRAIVTFLGEPGTRVAVDGVARGPCPVRISLDPGQHDARFSFDPTSESLSEGFRVKAGEKMTVRAEFTGARPTVRIQR
jgi:hypothetical protein